jgi:hypothetical protein
MRRFLFKLSIIVIPVGIIVAAFNFFVDPANLFFPRDYVAGVAGIMLRGHNVDNVSNYNERLLQEQMITRVAAKPNIVVMGSSRIMEIGSDFFPGKMVLNVGVSHANIHDLVAITGLLDSTGHLPEEIYMNVDAGLISEQHTSEWQSIAPYYYYFTRKYVDPKLISQKDNKESYPRLTAFFSLEYFKQSLEFLLAHGDKHYTDIQVQKPVKYGRFADGSVCYSETYKHPDTIKVASDAAITGAKEGLTLPNKDNIKLLKSLLAFFHQRGIKVHFLKLPYHFAYYAAVNKKQDNLFNHYDTIYNQIAVERQLTITGSFDATRYHMNGSDFYDMYHCSKEAIKKIFNTR